MLCTMGSQTREEIEAVRTDEVKKTLDKVLEGLSMSIQGLPAIPQEWKEKERMEES